MELLLEKLFESQAKVRLLRLFLRNPSTNFTIDEIVRGTGIKKYQALKELAKLQKLGFVASRNTQVVVSRVTGNGKTKKIRMRSQRVRVYTANPSFEFFRELRDLILRQVPESRHKLTQRLRRLGKVKLAIAAGAFINSDNSRIDLLVVGEKINRRKIESMLHQWEANAGRELTYALMTTDEFKYRLDMFDRFIRDVLESPHDKLINLLNIP
ncbi:MAG: hypothetical protein HYT40_02270 [Candidatus Sungbacteria bacterium]|uniref:Transcriptional regulator n=1 Tax=Candidatus Sungiibacteriota bacterium TaxID=2750080 RepID=A0A931WP51_9BACT|nr:hypothetical protein [Candidatus Sungbacteria bacterium]